MGIIKEAISLLTSGDRELWQIIGTTLVMSFFSTGISSVIGIVSGTVIGCGNFRGKTLLTKITNTLMGLPPVAAGLIVFMLFRSIGPFGSFHLMFTVPIMVIAQVVLITPIICSLTVTAVGERSKNLIETAKGLNLSRFRQIILIIKECSRQIISIVLLGFGRSIAEVGAVSLVGGNVQYKTRVMTTAILLEANKGNFEKAMAVGIVLMLLSLIVNIIARTNGGEK